MQSARPMLKVAAFGAFAGPVILFLSDLLLGSAMSVSFLWTICNWIAMMLMIPAAIGLTFLLASSGSRLAVIGGCFAFFGLVAGASMQVLFRVYSVLEEQGATAAVEQLRSTFKLVASTQMIGLTWPIGLILLSIACVMTRVVHIAVPILLFIGAIAFPIGRIAGSRAAVLISGATFILAFWRCGNAIVADVEGDGLSTELTINGRGVDLGRPIDVSIPLKFNGPQPNAFGVPRAVSEPCQAGDLVGDTRRGGSCNFEQYTFIPHCSGTHTECVGHITHQRISVSECLRDVIVPALLVSVSLAGAAGVSGESYAVPFGKGDRVITRDLLSSALITHGGLAERDAAPMALIVRTVPNHDSKLTRAYGEDPLPPYFTTEAMEYIVETGFSHILVDVPSIDRMNDEGKLSNHRIFWNVDQGSFETKQGTRVGSTITEFIYVPEQVADGEYALNMQIAPFAADASPSRPLLLRYI